VSRLNPINKKARKVEQAIVAASGDVEALQKKSNASAGRIYYPMGCTLNFTPGWEIDNSGGTAGLCQPVERPAQVPDHLNNAPDWTDKCAAATNDWRKVDVVFP
jgi:hypothetical protein